MAREFDSPWKEALDVYLEPFLSLFFPDLHDGIDWQRSYENLDTELQQILREAVQGKSIADCLYKVYLRSGQEVWILIHIEVQSQDIVDFAQRMFVFYYRLRDRYNCDIVSLAILGDDRPDWRPDRYQHQAYGCEISFRYRILKLLDWETREAELESHPNPMGLVVLAHLRSLSTHQDPAARHAWKFRLIRGLFYRGWNALQIRQLYRLIDWFLELPVELEQQLSYQLEQLEKEQKMPYVTNAEKYAIELGAISTGIDLIAPTLKFKFGESEAEKLIEELRNVKRLDPLKAVAKALPTATTIDELRALLQ